MSDITKWKKDDKEHFQHSKLVNINIYNNNCHSITYWYC